MKIYFLIIQLFLLASCSTIEMDRFPAQETRQEHVVLDIDWTIVKELKNYSPTVPENPRVIKVQDIYYYVNDGLEEIILEMLKHKEVRISFSSGGKSIRNHELLEKIKLSDGRSLKDIAYRNLGYEDLVEVEGVAAGSKFSERYKKDLRKITKNLRQLIMLDDTAKFVLDNGYDQNEHVFFIGKALLHFNSFADTKGLEEGEYIPKSYDEWLLDKHKLYILLVAFQEAYKESIESNMTLSEAMKKQEELLNLKDRQWNPLSRSYYKRFFGADNNSIKMDLKKCLEGVAQILGAAT